MKHIKKAVALTLALGTLGTTALSTATTAEAASVKWGSYQKYGKYETVMKKGYGIFQDKNFKKKVSTTDKNYHKTYLAKGYYKLSNGQKYVSLYNKDNKWIGYVNEKAMKVTKNKGGAALTFNKTVQVKKNNYPLWKDLDFKAKKGTTKSIYKKQVYVKPSYNHFNGSVYYSLYSSQDKWLGYINKDAVSVVSNLNIIQINKEIQKGLTQNGWKGTWHNNLSGFDKANEAWLDKGNGTKASEYFTEGYGGACKPRYEGQAAQETVKAFRRSYGDTLNKYHNGYIETRVDKQSGDTYTDYYFWK